MKKLFLLASAFVMAFGAMAQLKSEDLIKLDIERYDFGKIKQGTPVTTYFTITNISDKPVVIENAWAGCGCTTPEYSKEPIAPNGTSKIKVGYNAAAMGIFEKDVNIKLAGVDAAKVIKITGEVLAQDAYDSMVKSEPKKTEKASDVKQVNQTKATNTAKKTTAKKSSSKK